MKKEIYLEVGEEEGKLVKQGPATKHKQKQFSPDELIEKDILKEFLPGTNQYLILPKGTKIINAIYKLK